MHVVTSLDYGIKSEDKSEFINKDLVTITRISAPIYYKWGQLGRYVDRLSKRKLTTYWYSILAYNAGKSLLNNTPFDILLTRSYPFETVIIGLSLKKQFNLKWIAGINDPIPKYSIPWPYAQGRQNRIANYWSCRKAREALSTADNILFPSERLGRYLEGKLNLQFGQRMMVIPHIGWKIENDGTKNNKIDILHVGDADSRRISFNFLSCFYKAVQQYSSLRNKIRIVFVGIVYEHFKSFVKNNQMDSFFVFEKRVSYEESLKKISQASALLLLEAPLQEGIYLPSKFCDYAVAQKPLLLFSPENGTIADLVGGYAHPGFLGQAENRFKEGITRFLKRLDQGEDLSDYSYPRPWEFEEKKIIKDFLSCL